MLDMVHIAKVQKIKDEVIMHFDAGDWMLLRTYLGDSGSIISSHPRLLRSLAFGDDDYPSCVAEVVSSIIAAEPQAIKLIESMLDKTIPESLLADNSMQFMPLAISRTSIDIDTSLVSAMMPFSASFRDVRDTMREACELCGLNLRAADDVWENPVLIQDIFDLITKACIVIVDFTGKNPNVMYETGIAHALGKEVIPITQNLDDVPFDLKHYRVLDYKNNAEGRAQLCMKLQDRMHTILDQHSWGPGSF